MKRAVTYLWLLLMAVATCSCNGQGRVSANVEQVNPDTLVESRRELPLPEVPASLTVPEERAEYIICHFWDGMDFADTLRSHDRLFMEQNFANFISLFPHARQETLPPYIDKLLEQAAVDSVASGLVKSIAERYLDDPNSPMRNEEYYILFLEGQLRLPGLPEKERVHLAYRLETAKKNRPGVKATDFSYIDRDGNRRTLHNTQGKQLLLLFYDPACSHCSEILDGLRESTLIADLVAGNELSVLAVYTEGDRKLWDETKSSLPREWIVAIDDSSIVDRELYDLPAMPVIYLLGKEKNVLLKDPTPEALEAFLSQQIR